MEKLGRSDDEYQDTIKQLHRLISDVKFYLEVEDANAATSLHQEDIDERTNLEDVINLLFGVDAHASSKRPLVLDAIDRGTDALRVFLQLVTEFDATQSSWFLGHVNISPNGYSEEDPLYYAILTDKNGTYTTAKMIVDFYQHQGAHYAGEKWVRGKGATTVNDYVAQRVLGYMSIDDAYTVLAGLSMAYGRHGFIALLFGASNKGSVLRKLLAREKPILDIALDFFGEDNMKTLLQWNGDSIAFRMNRYPVALQWIATFLEHIGDREYMRAFFGPPEAIDSADFSGDPFIGSLFSKDMYMLMSGYALPLTERYLDLCDESTELSLLMFNDSSLDNTIQNAYNLKNQEAFAFMLRRLPLETKALMLQEMEDVRGSNGTRKTLSVMSQLLRKTDNSAMRTFVDDVKGSVAFDEFLLSSTYIDDGTVAPTIGVEYMRSVNLMRLIVLSPTHFNVFLELAAVPRRMLIARYEKRNMTPLELARQMFRTNGQEEVRRAYGIMIAHITQQTAHMAKGAM